MLSRTFQIGDDVAVLEQAKKEDVNLIKRMIDAAYSMYIERLGKPPAPMNMDIEELVNMRELYVLRINSETVGAVRLSKMLDSIVIDDLVVEPGKQGRGLGRVLMAFADKMAREEGMTALTLYTNEKMHENIALYNKLGFQEVARKAQDGFDRVFFRKDLDVLSDRPR